MFFFRKKKKKNTELDDSFNRVVDEINNLDDSDNPKKIERFVLESCEHIISLAKEMEAGKNQYILISEHLSDVEKIKRIDSATRSQIRDYSEKVYKLTKKKTQYKESEKRIEDDTFMLMQEHEDTVVEDIHRMENNEKYKEKVSSDIKYLESEKSRCEIDKYNTEDLIHKLKITEISIFVFVSLVVCAFLMFQINITNSIQMAFLVVLFLGVAVAFGIFIVIGNKRREYRKNIRKLNQVISLLNVERMRFVNISKALQYEMEIYDVTSSAELTYLWEQYLLTVKEVEAYRKNNIDLTYYVDKLYSVLKSFDLKYERKWIEQLDTLIDEEKIISLSLRLMEKRSIIKEQIDSNDKIITEERTEIDRLMREHNFYVSEVLEIISGVDAFCGKTRNEIKQIHIL